MTVVCDDDVMMLMNAADRWVRNNINPKSLFYVKATPGKGVIKLTLHNLKVDFETSLKLMGAMYDIRPQGVKVELSFPDNG